MTDKTPNDLPAAAQPEWIDVPKAAPNAEKPGKASKLGLIAMCFGLVALLTAIVAGAYLVPLAVLASVLGVAAVVLGVIAVFKRVRPFGPVIAGIATGVLAIIAAALVGAFALGTLVVDGISVSREAPPSEQHDWKAEENDAPQLLQWPANMASGGIVFGKELMPQKSAPLSDGDTPITTPINRANGVADIRLYVDYRCPHCATFEEVNGDTLESLVEDGAATLELVPLTFLDRASQGTYYSSRAAAAVSCVVNTQPNKAWDAHTALLDPEVQPQGEGPGLSNDEILAIVDDAVDGAKPEVADCIASETFVPFASALSAWVFSNPVPNAVDPAQAVQGTPLVLVNGVPYTGDPADKASFDAFLAQTLGTPSN